VQVIRSAVEVVQVVVDVNVDVVVVVTFNTVKVVKEMLLLAIKNRSCSFGETTEFANDETTANTNKYTIFKLILENLYLFLFLVMIKRKDAIVSEKTDVVS
jgi:hypothetical protein